MSTKLVIACALLAVLAPFNLALQLGEPGEPALALGGLDPVELASGREVAGTPDLRSDKGKFRYYFSAEGNQKAFEADPERYSIQFGGACARMGPVSGGGDPSRYSVYNSRIYIFASDACRNRFNAEPARFIDTADDLPVGTAETAELAGSLLERAVEAAGGREAFINLQALQFRHRYTHARGEKETAFTRLFTARFPGSFADIDEYDNWRGGWVLLGESGYLTWEKGASIEDSVRDFMERAVYRHPVTILKAWADGEAKAFKLNPGLRNGLSMERVAVYVKGAATEMWIDPQSGHVARISYRGRAPEGIAEIVEDFADYREVGNLMLPFSVQRQIDGKPVANPTLEVQSVLINDDVDLRDLSQPK